MFEEAVIPLDEWVSLFVEWLVENYRDFFQAIKWPVEATLNGIDAGLNWLPPVVVIVAIAIVAWRFSGKTLAVFSLVTLTFVGLLGLWAETMTTLAMVLASVVFCALVGVPLGIWAGRSDQVEMSMRPVLDAMQTTPAFVYLVPVVMLFGVGNVPGVIVTIIFALAPLIRLTNLGLRQVSPHVVEAAVAFGASQKQLLFKVQLPLAIRTIMAGLNQTLMMSLAMVVIGSMIAVGGLGQMVLRGIGRLDMALATVGGIGIVLLAITLDRLTQALSRPPREKKVRHWYDRGPAALILKTFQPKSSQ